MNVLSTLVVAVALASAAGCGRTPSVGSETHFLSWCIDGQGCGDDSLVCLCGVCTAVCSEAGDCSGLSDVAECVEIASIANGYSCTDPPAPKACDTECTEDDDCAPLGGMHRCDQGVCRALSTECDTGQVAGEDVVILGDGFYGENREVTARLEELARESGALGETETYRDYSTTLITPFGGDQDLSTQYAAAVADGTPRVVIMNAGGPNSLMSCPDPVDVDCPALAAVLTNVEEMWAQMADDGVEVVVDFFYPDPEDEGVKERFDALRPALEAACAASPVPCHFIDLRSTFDGRSEELLEFSGLLPTEQGAIATGDTIFSVLQRNCIAQ